MFAIRYSTTKHPLKQTIDMAAVTLLGKTPYKLFSRSAKHWLQWKRQCLQRWEWGFKTLPNLDTQIKDRQEKKDHFVLVKFRVTPHMKTATNDNVHRLISTISTLQAETCEAKWVCFIGSLYHVAACPGVLWVQMYSGIRFHSAAITLFMKKTHFWRYENDCTSHPDFSLTHHWVYSLWLSLLKFQVVWGSLVPGAWITSGYRGEDLLCPCNCSRSTFETTTAHEIV